MKIQAALTYVAAGYVGWLASGAWYAHTHNGEWGELGWEGAAVGGVLFACLFLGIIFTYGAVSRVLHRDEQPTSALIVSAVVGLPYWFVADPVHEYMRDRLGLPDGIWILETCILCAISFELIRFIDRRLRRHAAQNA
jgi:hypothetical protein